MASVVEKLYPPIIGGSIPAFYEENGTAIIAVPFSMNRAVNTNDVGGFSLKIKTVQSNVYIKTLNEITSSVEEAIGNRVVKFKWDNFQKLKEDGTPKDIDSFKIKIGQYLKLQLAYVSNPIEVTNATHEIVTIPGTVGYFSTVGTIKFTDKPKVYIAGLGESGNQIEIFKQTYTGVYETGVDRSERPYAYNFYLFDAFSQLVETSGWRLHNSSINSMNSESRSLKQASDTYTFQTSVKVNNEYYVQYGVRTLNNLEVFSPLYTCLEPPNISSNLYTILKAENVFEEGYINLHLEMKPPYTNKTIEQIQQLYPEVAGYVVEETAETGEIRIYRAATEENAENVLLQTLYSVQIDPEAPVSIEICRSEKTDNFSSWRTLQKLYFTNYNTVLDWSYKDLTIEQGITYRYCFRQYSKSAQSARSVSNDVIADFEDMFLWDGKRQLKIRFNPKVSSFKANKLETKTDTIGSRYPFIFRNGIVDYKEFPISGLISYLADNNELFINHEEDLNIILGQHASRSGQLITKKDGATAIYQKITPVNQSKEDILDGHSWEQTQTLDSIGYNMRAERRFKMKLLEWLGNGEIKMFKSASEGNFLVRLLNISLSPEDKVGRMLHTFTATAYEVEEFTYDNLLSLGFLNLSDSEAAFLRIESVNFRDKIDLITDVDISIKLNDNTISDLLQIMPSPNVEGGQNFYLRIGKNEEGGKAMIAPGFKIESQNSQLPDVYFNLGDNLEILREEYGLGENSTLDSLKKAAISLVSDSILTYKYYLTKILVGDIGGIEEVSIRNEVRTIIGPTTVQFNLVSNIDEIPEEEEILHFFVLNFKEKPIRQLDYINGKYYEPSNHNREIKHFDALSLYEIDSTYYTVNSRQELQLINFVDTTIFLLDENNKETTFSTIPILNLNEHMYRQITLGNGIYLECAYQVKITKFKDTTITEG